MTKFSYKMTLAHIFGMCSVNDNKICILKEAFRSIKDHTFDIQYYIILSEYYFQLASAEKPKTEIGERNLMPPPPK